MFFCSKYSVNKLNKINEQTVLKFSPCDATPMPFVYCIKTNDHMLKLLSWSALG